MATMLNEVEIGSGIGNHTATPAARKVKVVEIGTGLEHELPGDTATRDGRTLAYFSFPSGAVLPLVTRPPEVAFYVCSDRWPGLLGKLVRRAS